MTDQTMTMTPERVMDELDALLTRAKELALHITEGAARAALSRPAVPETLAKWASNPEEDDGIGWKQGYEAARRWVAMQLSWRSDLTSVVNASSATEPAEQHPDDAAVDRFAQAMKAKLAQARAKGRSGWDDPAQCSPEYLADLLAGHVRKGNDGNFVDVANFAMMLHQRGAAPSVMPDAIRRSAAEESSGVGCYDCGLQYGGASWIEAVIPDKAWNLIRPEGAAEGCGILCISCIAKRLREHGIEHCPVWLCGTEPLRPFGQKDCADNLPVLRQWEPGSPAQKETANEDV